MKVPVKVMLLSCIEKTAGRQVQYNEPEINTLSPGWEPYLEAGFFLPHWNRRSALPDLTLGSGGVLLLLDRARSDKTLLHLLEISGVTLRETKIQGVGPCLAAFFTQENEWMEDSELAASPEYYSRPLYSTFGSFRCFDWASELSFPRYIRKSKLSGLEFLQKYPRF